MSVSDSHPQYRAPVLLAIMAVLVFISACGFHPRGSLISAAELGSIYVDAGRDLSISEEVKEALIDSSFELAPNRDDATILLRLSNEQESERVVSVNSSGRVSELELTHAVNMLIAVSNEGEKPVYQPGQSSNRVEVNREYTYDETGVLGKENEARILRNEMKRDLVRQIVLRSIASLAPLVPS
ncbi:MAG: LPS assembly lipoprotein LptE [Granulosicoccus sp.]